MTVHQPAASFTRIAIKPLSPSIGAEIEGIDLSGGLDDGLIAEIRAALLEHQVIFFRDQDISTEQHIAFARRFGALEIHPATPKTETHREVLRIRHDENSRGDENIWHSDVTWRAEPSLGSVLRARIIPPSGGDTLFASMTAAYDGLSRAMQEWICTLTAVHDIAPAFAKRLKKTPEELHAKYPPQEHPVVRTHPETGKRALYVNVAFTTRIRGLHRKESDWLLQHLYDQASLPEYQCRFRWTPNAIAFWDNRSSQHYAASDYYPQVREMERVTVAGDRPFFTP